MDEVLLFLVLDRWAI